jgi:hypothetical protein
MVLVSRSFVVVVVESVCSVLFCSVQEAGDD